MSRLVCPACDEPAAPGERFCARCGMPLVHEGAPPAGEPRSEAQRRARLIRPEYARGELVRAASGRNQTEAEFIQNLLLEEGVPSTLRRTRGFDVPDFLAAGPRDVLVPLSAAEAAREILLDAGLAGTQDAHAGDPDPRRVLAGLLGGVAVVAAVAWVGTELLPL